MRIALLLGCLLLAFLADSAYGQDYILPDEDLSVMKDEVRRRCNLPKAEEESYPWYYHYELGLSLKKRSDWQRALDSFLTALDHRSEPKRSTRIYGMWFVDYYPYYNIGVSHFQLNNWKCALDAFRLSQIYESIPKGSAQYRNLVDLSRQAQRKLSQDAFTN